MVTPEYSFARKGNSWLLILLITDCQIRFQDMFAALWQPILLQLAAQKEENSILASKHLNASVMV
jgi:hypothetical protein